MSIKIRKRVKSRNNDNAYYLAFVDHYIETICAQGKINELQHLEKNLTKDEYVNFVKLCRFITTRKVFKLALSSAWKNIEEKQTKIDIKIVPRLEVPDDVTPIHLPAEILNEIITAPAKKEIGLYYEFKREAEKEKKKFDVFLQEFDKQEFLRLISKVLAILANFKMKENLTNLIRLYKSWTLDIRSTFKKIKNKRKGEQAKELLRIILGNKVDNIEEVRQEDENDTKRFHNRLGGNIFVNIDEELDASRLTHGNYRIETLKFHSPELPNIIDDLHASIHISIGDEPKKLRLWNYYELRRKNLSPKLLTSKDLLDNILIVYIIKLAQNGDEQAAEFLFNCYKNSVKGVAINFIRQKAGNLGLKKFNQIGALSYDDVESVAMLILRLLITGDKPDVLLKYLSASAKIKPEVEHMLNRKAYNAVMDSYSIAYSTLQVVIKLAQNRDKEFRKRLKNLIYRSKKAQGKQRGEEQYLHRIFSLSLNHIHQVETDSLAMSTFFDPYNLIVYSRNYNKNVYSPNKKSNFTYWLFGKQNTKYKGMLWEKLNDWYKSKTYTKNGKRLVKSADFSQGMDLSIADDIFSKGDKAVDSILDSMDTEREGWGY